MRGCGCAFCKADLAESEPVSPEEAERLQSTYEASRRRWRAEIGLTEERLGRGGTETI